MSSLLTAARITRVNLHAALEYRADFVIGVILGIVWQGTVLVFATVLLNRFPGLSGWAKGEVLLIAAMRMCAHALYLLLFGSIAWTPTLVADGRIEGYLLRPMSVHRQVVLSSMNINAVGDMSVGVLLFTLALGSAEFTWSPLHVAYIAAAMAGAILIEAGLATAIASFAFRNAATTPWSRWLDEIFATFGNYPLSILPGLVQSTLTFAIPVAFLAYLPAAVVTGHRSGLGVPYWAAVVSPLAGVVVFGLGKLVWRHNLNRYAGVN